MKQKAKARFDKSLSKQQHNSGKRFRKETQISKQFKEYSMVPLRLGKYSHTEHLFQCYMLPYSILIIGKIYI